MHVRRTLALTFAVPLLLAGCSDEAQPTPKMPDPTSSSSTPSPTESETPQAESAEDFIRRWADIMREMQVTGDTSEFRALGPDCDSCNAAASRVEEIYSGGGSIRWKGWTIVSLKPYGKAVDQFRLEVRSAPTRYRESADGDWKTIMGGPSTRLLELQKSNDGWLIARTAELAS